MNIVHGRDKTKMIVKYNEQILTIHESIIEGDAFEYCVNYDEKVEVIFAKHPDTTQSGADIKNQG